MIKRLSSSQLYHQLTIYVVILHCVITAVLEEEKGGV